MADSLLYVYAIVAPSTPLAVAPPGIDDAPVELVATDVAAALASRVDAAVYGEGMDERVGDVAWLGPRATAHDAVITWASDLGAVIPLPLLSLFRSDEAVRAMLAGRASELRRLLTDLARGREYGVRVFRLDDELRRSLASFSGAVAALEREVDASASPGQRYLIGRKLEAARRDAVERVGMEVADAAYHVMSVHAIAATKDVLPRPIANQSGAAVLNGYFFVAHERTEEFRAAVTTFVRAHEHRGFRVEFTGPWPPYHFTQGTDDGH